jgi:hypothetical protein
MTRTVRIWPVIGVIAVAAIWSISALANWYAGTLLASDPLMKHVLGAASVACDVLKAIALFIVLGALMNRRWVAVGVGLVLFALCTAWSLRSAAYFAADAITEKVAVVETSNAIAMARLQIIDAKTRRAAFLAEQQVTVTGPRAVRKDALQANQQSSAEFNALTGGLEQDLNKLADSKQVLKASTDPLADLLQVDRQVTILFTALFFALLMELASSTGFWLIARSAHRPAPPASETTKTISEVTHIENVPKQLGTTELPLSALAIAPEQSSPPDDEVDEEVEITVLPTPASNVVKLNFVDSDTRRLQDAIRDVVDAGDEKDRVLIATLAKEVSRVLPKNKAIKTKAQIVHQLAPAVVQIYPGAEKRRASGHTWIYGVRLRTQAESANG